MRHVIVCCICIFMITSCQKQTEHYVWEHVKWHEFSALNNQQMQTGLAVWQQSCLKQSDEQIRFFDRMIDGKAMQNLCVASLNASDATAFLQSHFNIYRIRTTVSDYLHLTGYYIPLLHVSNTPDNTYHVPIYAKPDKQYRTLYSRKEIDEGALHGKTSIIAYADNAVDVFFLQIQGSGYAQYPDGSRALLRYAGKNDMAYTAIGGYFIQNGLATKEEMSLQWLKDWLNTHPEQAPAIMQRNASYVFFEHAAGEADIVGAQGTPLEAMHSVAIDPQYLSYGVPLFLDADDMQHMVVTQDTGSAIKGRLRADLFAGAGDMAEVLAGTLNRNAALYVFFPKDVPYVQQ